MRADFILDPYAQRWKAGHRKDEAFKGAAEGGPDVELRCTERPRHGTELDYRAVLYGYFS